MGNSIETDEYLEAIWCMKEKNTYSIEVLKKSIGENFNFNIINTLISENIIKYSELDKQIILTQTGEAHARRIIRSHRIAERLIHDVLGGEFEAGACEFEHTINPQIVNSICTLLGHPTSCPHGEPIPAGDCCNSNSKSVKNAIIPLTALKVGESSKVAYIKCNCDHLLHIIDGLQIKPGAIVKLHQTYPSYVIECEDTHIALDKEVAVHICVWAINKELKNF